MELFTQLMYTSCGWFFEDISRIESQQVIAYAIRAAQLAQEVSGANLLSGYSELLSACKPNDRRYPDGGLLLNEVLSRDPKPKNSAG